VSRRARYVHERDRGLVRPLQVVDEQRDGGSSAHGPQESGHSLEEATPCTFALQRQRFAASERVGLQLREELGDHGGPCGRQAPQVGGPESVDQGVDHRAVGEMALRGVGAPLQHARTLDGGEPEKMLAKARLADPGLAGHDDRPASPGPDPGPFLPEAAKLRFPADERDPAPLLALLADRARLDLRMADLLGQRNRFRFRLAPQVLQQQGAHPLILSQRTRPIACRRDRADPEPVRLLLERVEL